MNDTTIHWASRGPENLEALRNTDVTLHAFLGAQSDIALCLATTTNPIVPDRRILDLLPRCRACVTLAKPHEPGLFARFTRG